jgi:hypothetical protein
MKKTAMLPVKNREYNENLIWPAGKLGFSSGYGILALPVLRVLSYDNKKSSGKNPISKRRECLIKFILKREYQ